MRRELDKYRTPGNIAVRGGMTMTTVEEETETPVCSVCARPTGFGNEDKGEPPVNLARCPAPGGMECRAVAQAVAPWRRENEVLRSNCDHLSSENASLSRQVESMAMRIESLAEELAKPEDVRLREVVDALDGRAVIFDGLGARVTHLLDEMDEWIARAGDAERRLEDADAKLTAVRVALTEAGVPEVEPYPKENVTDHERSLRTGGRVIGAVARIECLVARLAAAGDVVKMARQLVSYDWEARLDDSETSDAAKHDSRELSYAIYEYDRTAKS